MPSDEELATVIALLLEEGEDEEVARLLMDTELKELPEEDKMSAAAEITSWLFG